MRIVVALGGNALLRRGEPMTADTQRHNVRIAARALAPLARQHQLVLSHGNGPQIGLLALQAAAYKSVEAVPARRPGRGDAGHDRLSARAGARQSAADRGAVRQPPDHDRGRRARSRLPGSDQVHRPRVRRGRGQSESPPTSTGSSSRTAQSGGGWSPSPRPKRIFEIRPIHWLLDHGTIVICAGGGGIPTVYDTDSRRRTLEGVEVVIDKDFAGALLARDHRGRHVRHGHRCRRRLPGLGYAERALPAPHHAGRARAVRTSRPAAWGPKSQPRANSSPPPASPRRLAPSPTSNASSPAKAGTVIEAA